MNYGYQNELDFVELFNNKYIYELDNSTKKFLKELFDELIEEGEIIKSWKNKTPQKADIFIKYKNYVKGISLKYGNNNSIVKIVVTNDDSTVTIKVINNGITIPSEEIEQIFDKFYRSDSSRSSSTGGTGLGLAIARNIINMHSGNIYATSEDGVTSFCVVLNREV